MTEPALSKVSPAGFRHACGAFATGVAIVATRFEGRPVAMTVNSFASVSLTPPLVVWSLRKASRARAAFEAAGHFAVSVLAREQGGLARHFARGHDPFAADLPLIERPGRGPLVAGALAHLDCDTHALVDGGDHVMLVGRVRGLAVRPGAPLVFFSGRFETLAV